jgi:hypothetical protein
MHKDRSESRRKASKACSPSRKDQRRGRSPTAPSPCSPSRKQQRRGRSHTAVSPSRKDKQRVEAAAAAAARSPAVSSRKRSEAHAEAKSRPSVPTGAATKASGSQQQGKNQPDSPDPWSWCVSAKKKDKHTGQAADAPIKKPKSKRPTEACDTKHDDKADKADSAKLTDVIKTKKKEDSSSSSSSST